MQEKEEGGVITDIKKEESKESGKQSKNRKVDKIGRLLVDFIAERNWIILNANVKGDKEGEYIFTEGVGCTVINYIVMEKESK